MLSSFNQIVGLAILSLAAVPASAAPVGAGADPQAAAKAIDLPRATLQRYVGSYQSPVDPIVVALDESGGLAVTLGQQPAVSIRPVSETEFDAPSVNARVTFHVDGGAVTRMVIRQGERELSAERVKD